MTKTPEIAILAGGCFWGVQDLIRKQPGVISTRVGYTGGEIPNATYRNHGNHAEAIEITFDPEQISYRDLLEFFFQIHDPTTMNRQGNDIGASYRSAIFYTTDEQRAIAEDTIADVDASGIWPGKRWPPDRRRPRGPMSVASPAGKPGDVVVDGGERQRPFERALGRRSERDVVAHRVRHELGHLGQERGVRRHEEGGAVGEQLAVPAHLAAHVGTPRQSEQGAEQRALARAHRSGDDDELAAVDGEIDAPHTHAAGVQRREAAQVETLQRHPLRAAVDRSPALLAPFDRQAPRAHGVGGVLVGHQPAHPLEGHRGLLASRQHPADHPAAGS